jgi:hypothetical protein
MRAAHETCRIAIARGSIIVAWTESRMRPVFGTAVAPSSSPTPLECTFPVSQRRRRHGDDKFRMNRFVQSSDSRLLEFGNARPPGDSRMG